MSQIFHIKGDGQVHGYALVTDNIEVNITMEATAARIAKAHRHLQMMITDSMIPLMPHVTGDFQARTRGMNMAMLGTEYIYAGVGPMGRYLYHGKVMVEPWKGKRRRKKKDGKEEKVDEDIGHGPMLIPGVGLRFHEGAKLKVTSRNLDTSNGASGNWVPFWFDEAKRRHLSAWVRGVQKDLEGG